MPAELPRADPRVSDFEALNAHLLVCCRRRLADRLRGHDSSIGERLQHDLATFQKPLPAPYERVRQEARQRHSLSLVRYRLNDTRCRPLYGHQAVLIRGLCAEGGHRLRRGRVIARHTVPTSGRTSCSIRCTTWPCWSKRPTRSTRLRPLAAWTCPREFATLRRLLEGRMGKVRQARVCAGPAVMEVFDIHDVGRRRARRHFGRGAIGFDAVKHLVLFASSGVRHASTCDLSVSAQSNGR